jgi:hypothetical protein
VKRVLLLNWPQMISLRGSTYGRHALSGFQGVTWFALGHHRSSGFSPDLCPVRALKGANLPIGHVGRRSDRKAEFLLCQRLRGFGGGVW